MRLKSSIYWWCFQTEIFSLVFSAWGWKGDEIGFIPVETKIEIPDINLNRQDEHKIWYKVMKRDMILNFPLLKEDSLKKLLYIF